MKNLNKIVVGALLLLTFASNVFAASAEQNSLFTQRSYLSPSINYVFADSGRNSDDAFGGQLALGYNFLSNFSVEAEVKADSLDINTGGSFDLLGAGLNGLARFPLKSTAFEPFLIGGLGALSSDGPTSGSTNVYLSAGVGTFIAVSQRLLLRVDARYRIDTDDQNIPSQDPFEDVLLSVGLIFPLGKDMAGAKDDDQDGVRNENDLCPNTPLGTEVDVKGCPLDDDHDGVTNNNDQCPGTVEGATVDIRGCEIDSDADQVVDRLDRCPNTPPGTPVDEQGCPLDNDRDGVANPIDQCPNTAQGIEVDRVGCERDDDKDSIVNSKDLCPNTPLGTRVDETGCPLKNVITLSGLKFKFNSVELANAEQNESLKSATSTLLRYPDTKVVIVGHTDSIGAANYNLHLSLDRANAIRQHLIDQGVSSANLSTAGKGEEEPIAENSTEEGRAINRRVELHILEQ